MVESTRAPPPPPCPPCPTDHGFPHHPLPLSLLPFPPKAPAFTPKGHVFPTGLLHLRRPVDAERRQPGRQAPPLQEESEEAALRRQRPPHHPRQGQVPEPAPEEPGVARPDPEVDSEDARADGAVAAGRPARAPVREACGGGNSDRTGTCGEEGGVV